MMICALFGLVMAQPAAIRIPDAPCAGWKASPQRTVTPSGVFRYMNGAGELYLAYGFRELQVRDYSKPGQPAITCEVYRLPSSADAYGLFSQDRTGQPLKIGQGAVYGSGLLIAWQGRYFVRVMADRETPEAKLCMQGIARQVVKLCGPAGSPPAALAWLPKEGLDPESIRYFHTQTVLNYFHFVASENILDLSLKTQAVMGSYAGKGGKTLAVVIGYPSAQEARAALAHFSREYLKGLKTEGEHNLAELENGKWVGVRAKDKKVLLVLESPSRAELGRVMAALEKA